MARKRMILEEIEEKEQLVAGTVDNPLKLTEKQKSLLVSIYLRQKSGEMKKNSVSSFWDSSTSSLERLIYLGLLEVVTLGDLPEGKVKKTALQKKVDKTLIPLLQNKPFCQETASVFYDLRESESSLNQRIYRTTLAGAALLLKGKVTVSL
jgi:hypothetical protein